MACSMRIHNNTPMQLIRVPSDTYPIRVSLLPDASATPCSFKDEWVVAVIDGDPQPMVRIFPNSNTWQYMLHAYGGFEAFFVARYRSRRSWPLPWRWGLARYPAEGVRQFEIVAAPAVTVSPTELRFYFDDQVPNTDKTVQLRNGTLSHVHVGSAAIRPIESQPGEDAFFTLISPTAFDFVVPPNGSQSFVVRFASTTEQRTAELVITTSARTFTVRLDGKYFLW